MNIKSFISSVGLLVCLNVQASTCDYHKTKHINTQAPVIWTEPAFPTQLDDVTVYYDAKEGNGALANFSGTVYAHTGVITSASTSPTDWQHVQGVWGTPDANTVMTSEGNSIYSISYNITDYYGVSSGELVEELAFVFRDAGGNIVGRSADGTDIYTDVFPPTVALLATLVSPSNDNTVVYLGDQLDISLQINKEADVEIRDNGVLVYTGSGQSIFTTITATTLDFHTVDISITDGVGNTQQIETFYSAIAVNNQVVDPPSGIKNGLNYESDDRLLFQLYAPNKEHVFLLTSENNFRPNSAFRMNQSTDGESYWISLDKSLFSNGRNTYQYLVDGNINIADPYSEVVLDPWNDATVPQYVLAELPPYPAAANTIVTAFDLDEVAYDWQVDDYVAPQKSELVIYEILMRDFLEDHNYQSLKDTLDYLDRLGVTAIELMPINEFEGNQSWGYNPSFHGAIDKYYGSRDDLKAVIDECHLRGIAVILDVVYNHVFSQSPLAQLYWDAANFQPTSENPWLNVTARHPFNVGYDVNHESTATKTWVKQILTSMIEEYRFDGFRFDLSKGFTQTNSINNAGLMAQYDQSRIDILKDYADHIWSLDTDSYVILEHFADNSEEKELSAYGMMLWGNMTYAFQEAAMGYVSDMDWLDYQVRDWDNPNLIGYMESHDEERIMYKVLQFGNSQGNYDTKQLATGLGRIEAASLIFTAIPGPKMLWQFGEIGYDYSINTCVNGSISDNCRLDPKPIKWDYLEQTARKRLYDRSANINYLRSLPTFSTTDYTFENDDPYIKTVHLNHPEMDAVAISNFNVDNAAIDPAFQSTGVWYEYFTGAELNVTDANQDIEFFPGEYRLYTTEKIIPPTGVVTSTSDIGLLPLMLYPNPSISGEVVTIYTDNTEKIIQLDLIDMNGKSLTLDFEQSAEQTSFQLPVISDGVYQVKIQRTNTTQSTKMVVLSNKN